MAFGFLKKLVQKITGKDTSASKGGKGSSNGAKKDGGGRGRRGDRDSGIPGFFRGYSAPVPVKGQRRDGGHPQRLCA